MKKFIAALIGSTLIVTVVVNTVFAFASEAVRPLEQPSSSQGAVSGMRLLENPPANKSTGTTEDIRLRCTFASSDRIVNKNQSVLVLSYENAEDGELAPRPYTAQILDTSASKQLVGFDPSEISYFEDTEQTDQEENLVSNHTYLYVKVKIKNEAMQKNQLSLNSLALITLPGAEYKLFSKCPRMMDNRQQAKDSPCSFQYLFNPYEEAIFTLGFIVEEACLEDPDLVLSVGGTGLNCDDGTQRFIRLNSN